MTAENRPTESVTNQPNPAGTMQTGPDERELVFTNLIDAPRTEVFRAWTDPGQLAQWWGPRGMTNPICEVDLRPGGTYRIVMRDPEGGDHPVSGIYREIAAPERLVFSISPPMEMGQPNLDQVWTVTFAEHDGKTRLITRNQFRSGADREAALQLGHAEGVSQSLDRLHEHMASLH